MNVVESGEEILASSGLFGGTYTLLKNLRSYGIHVKFLGNLDKDSLKNAMNGNTKIVFAETLGNPKLDVLDIEEVSKVCTDHNVIFIVDSTVTTPYLIKPIEYGADIVVHSTSKYINGTSNSIGGIIVDGGSIKYKDDKCKNFKDYSNEFGKMAYTAKLRNTVGKDIGASLAPFNAFLKI